MKKLIIVLFFSFILVILTCSCSNILQRTPKIDNFDKLDFTKYTKNGFLFTPLLFSGDYESVGLINYRFIPGATYKNETTANKDIIWTVHYWERDKFSYYDILDSVYIWSSLNGANAIVNLKLEVVSVTFGYGYDNPTEIQGVDVSGFAIKRKK